MGVPDRSGRRAPGWCRPRTESGQLHPRAVPLYNALHMFAGPVTFGAISLWLAPLWIGAALTWTAHVLFDHALGFGLRDYAGR